MATEDALLRLEELVGPDRVDGVLDGMVAAFADYRRRHVRTRLDVDGTIHGSMREVLNEIGARGFAWHNIARCLGVSVTTVRKWRHGEPATTADHAAAARFLNVCQYLEGGVPIDDVAGWFETPLVPDPAITPLDLYAEGHEHLVLDFAEQREPDPSAVLDRYDSDWRGRRSDFEVVEATDGDLSIQRRP